MSKRMSQKTLSTSHEFEKGRPKRTKQPNGPNELSILNAVHTAQGVLPGAALRMG